jgi:hypothetical protein
MSNRSRLAVRASRAASLPPASSCEEISDTFLATGLFALDLLAFDFVRAGSHTDLFE